MPATTCPECGVDLASKNRAKHAEGHWGGRPGAMSELKGEALARAKAVMGGS